jgi:hypothetical protein
VAALKPEAEGCPAHKHIYERGRAMKTKLYVLTSSQDSTNIRYVGKTIKELRDRLQGHINNSKTFKINCNGIQGFKHNHHKARWIRKVLVDGFKVEVTLIGVINGKCKRAERAYIKWFRDEGFNLVNSTDGGEGTYGFKPTKKSRKRMSDAGKGKPDTAEVKEIKRLAAIRRAPPNDEARQTMREVNLGDKNPMWNTHPSKKTLLQRSISMKAYRQRERDEKLHLFTLTYFEF